MVLIIGFLSEIIKTGDFQIFYKIPKPRTLTKRQLYVYLYMRRMDI
jgi:hypothetical protein